MQSVHMLYAYQAAGQDEACKVLSDICAAHHACSAIARHHADAQQHCVRTSTTPGVIGELDITTVLAF